MAVGSKFKLERPCQLCHMPDAKSWLTEFISKFFLSNKYCIVSDLVILHGNIAGYSDIITLLYLCSLLIVTTLRVANIFQLR